MSEQEARYTTDRPRHPLADAVGNGWVVTESRSPLVALTAARINLLTEARAAGSTVILVTDERSSLTPACAQVWRDAGARWAVRGASGLLWDGFSGRILSDVTDAASGVRPTSVDDIAVDYLRSPAADAVELSVTVSLRHRARATTVLGGPAEAFAVLGELAASPAGALGNTRLTWGATEPVGNPWDRPELTAFARSQMPADSLLLARSARFAATISASRTSQGVEEVTRAQLSLGAPTTLAFERTRLGVVSWLSELALTAMPLVALVLARPAQDDLAWRPRLQHPPVPLTLLIGPPGVRALGADIPALEKEFGALVVGRPRIPALLFPLGTLGDATWQKLDAVLARFGQDRLNEVLGTTAAASMAAATAARGEDIDAEQP